MHGQEEVRLEPGRLSLVPDGVEIETPRGMLVLAAFGASTRRGGQGCNQHGMQWPGAAPRQGLLDETGLHSSSSRLTAFRPDIQLRVWEDVVPVARLIR